MSLSQLYIKADHLALALGAAVIWVTFSYPAWESAERAVVPGSARAEASASTPTPDYSDKSRELYVNLKAALVVDNVRGRALYAKNAEKSRPIASISKLLMAVTLLDMNYARDSLITVTREDMRRSSKSNLYRGDRARAEDLFFAALVGSDNRAARALARTFGGSYGEFAEKMNRTAHAIGLKHTSVVEPTGLDKRNRSSAARTIS
ncbi:MAG: D-alanyl-D-alanine carboxypeptidase family protein, partial [Candidatus Zixiibacteriota bacterium]